MVRITRTVIFLLILDHNIGTLVDVNRKPSDGSISRCLDVFRAFYHCHYFCYGEPAGGYDCELHAGCAL